MTDRSGTSTPEQPSVEGHGASAPRTYSCPAWCVHHDEFDHGTPDHCIRHWGTERESGGCWVQLTRSDVLRAAITDEVEVLVNQAPVSVVGAAELIAVLSKVVADSLGPDQQEVVIRDVELPEGQEVAVYPDLNVVAVSRRLDGAGRRRALDKVGA